MDIKLTKRIALILFILTSSCTLLQGQSSAERVRGTNPKYDLGDWITYSGNRFVNTVTIGNQFVYFGTTGGITRYDYWARQWDYPHNRSTGMADNDVRALLFDPSTSVLWAASRTAIGYFSQTTQEWRNNFLDESSIGRSDPILELGYADDGVYARTRLGRIYRANRFGGPFFSVPGGANNGAQRVRWNDDRVREGQRFPPWFMDSGALFHSDGFVQDFRLRRGQVTSFKTDRWQNGYLGTWGFGGFVADDRTDRLSELRYGLFSPDVRAIAFDDRGMWLAGFNTPLSPLRDVPTSGITYWDQVDETWQYHEADFRADILTDDISRMVVSDSLMLAATRFGVNVFQPDRDRWKRITTARGLNHEFVYDIICDSLNAYIATEGGLNRISLQAIFSDTLRATVLAGDDLKLQRVLDLELHENLLWAATDYGIYVYDLAKRKGGFVEDVNGPIGEAITSVRRYQTELWFGTRRAVYPYDVESKTWLPAPARNLNINAPVRAIDVDEKSVWLGTTNGVFKYNRKDKFWVHYTVQDGLADNRVFEVKLDGDYVWFGTPEGLTLFYWNSPHRVD